MLATISRAARDGRAALLSVSLMVLTIAACDSPGGGQVMAPGPTIEPVEHSLLRGIPLPTGFKMVPERSVARQSGTARVAQCEFEGYTYPDAVARFYVDNMTVAKFALTNKRFDNGEYNMRFESATEECNVRIRPRGGNRTTLVIDLGPLNKEAT